MRPSEMKQTRTSTSAMRDLGEAWMRFWFISCSNWRGSFKATFVSPPLSSSIFAHRPVSTASYWSGNSSAANDENNCDFASDWGINPPAGDESGDAAAPLIPVAADSAVPTSDDESSCRSRSLVPSPEVVVVGVRCPVVPAMEGRAGWLGLLLLLLSPAGNEGANAEHNSAVDDGASIPTSPATARRRRRAALEGKDTDAASDNNAKVLLLLAVVRIVVAALRLGRRCS